jgi:hypothetical protein
MSSLLGGLSLRTKDVTKIIGIEFQEKMDKSQLQLSLDFQNLSGTGVNPWVST